MICFALKCPEGHGFDSWFQSGKAFETLLEGGHLECPTCGSHEIAKAIMTPRVTGARDPVPPEAEKAPPVSKPLTLAPKTDLERALAQLKREISEKSDYVGDQFVSEVREIHAGKTPKRAIHGEARLDEARKLIEDGIPVLPLPFLRGNKLN